MPRELTLTQLRLHPQIGTLCPPPPLCPLYLQASGWLPPRWPMSSCGETPRCCTPLTSAPVCWRSVAFSRFRAHSVGRGRCVCQHLPCMRMSRPSAGVQAASPVRAPQPHSHPAHNPPRSCTTRVQAVREGFLRPAAAGRPCHRLAVFDYPDLAAADPLDAAAGLRITTIISQSDVVRRWWGGCGGGTLVKPTPC